MRAPTKLSNIQLELLKIFSGNISEKDLKEVKRRIALYFAEKTVKEANKVWEEKGYDDKWVNKMLKSHLRTPYKKVNR